MNEGPNRVFSLTWPASMQIYGNKRKRLYKKGVQLPQDWFGTPIWPPRRHVKTLYRFFGIRDLPYFKVGIRDFKSILGARFGIERMHGMWDAENNPRDYGTRENMARDDGIKEPY